jgi:hypothetical protein
MLAILRGGNKVEATWMTDHKDLAKRHWKKNCYVTHCFHVSEVPFSSSYEADNCESISKHKKKWRLVNVLWVKFDRVRCLR